MHKFRKMLPVCFALIVWPAVSARADVKPHPLFADGCVLQQGMPVPVWGFADEGERVTVSFQGQRVSTTARGGGWLVRLDNLKPGGPFRLEIEGRNKVEIANVLVGEVWLGGGQSNMAWPLKQSADAAAEIARARHPLLRLFTVARGAADAPASVARGEWAECTPETAADFSAVAYFFGRALQRARPGVPVGLIHSSVGGTPAEAWMSRPALEANPQFKDILDRYAEAVQNYPRTLAKHKAALEEHERLTAQAKQQGREPPPAPQPPYGPEHRSRPAALYNAMIAPLMPYAVRGVIWYQGEGNRGRAFQYRALFPALIHNWREAWHRAGGQRDFPFLFVQLAPYLKIVSEPQESALAELREAQLLTSRNVPKTAMAVITDAGDENDIHPRQKAPVGERLALAARAVAYGEKIVYSGPIYAGMKIDGDRATLNFKHGGGGLAAKADGAEEAKGAKLRGFAIAGEDRKFVRAEAEIRGDKVVVWSAQVARPVAVRYGWADYPIGNLQNRDGLPASPFRTDDFPMITAPAGRTEATGGRTR